MNNKIINNKTYHFMENCIFDRKNTYKKVGNFIDFRSDPEPEPDPLFTQTDPYEN